MNHSVQELPQKATLVFKLFSKWLCFPVIHVRDSGRRINKYRLYCHPDASAFVHPKFSMPEDIAPWYDQ
jgi:hypothetical protein